MDKKQSSWWGRHRPTKRRLIQTYAALLYNAHLKGFISGEIYTGPIKNLCVPGLNCYSCPGAVGACPLGALQNALASSGARAPYYILGILMLFGLILGRTICGWLCPMGWVQDLLDKIPVPKLRKNRFTRVLSWMKYVILAIFVVLVPLMYSVQSYPVPAFCKYICPAGTLEGAMGLLSNPVHADKFSMLDILFTRKFVILVLLLLGCTFAYRAFCRFLCPLGAIYGLFAKVSLLGVRVDPGKCTHCGRCVQHCRMDIRHVGDHECIQCGECIQGCPEKAISWKAGKITLAQGEESGSRQHGMRSVCAWGLALALLCGVLWACNRPEPSEVVPQEIATQEDVPVGSEVGMRCPDFTVPLYGEEGGTFELSQTLGKVTVINFWATWCTPCCGELPYFQALQDAYPQDVAVVAIHSNLVTDDVEAYWEGQGYTLPAALDSEGTVIASLGGSTMLPMTVVLDQSGCIVYNQVGSVTYEQLQSIVEPLL